ncbi:Uncharacterized membrane protein YckC, RDD family [Epsilonproteobacteria bacterium SCGC AD-308-O04]|nr:Uncharacterized membrane protein YckC, RDD family [Epsilonproteobacteria bacterium SCGC AD-308-O04]
MRFRKLKKQANKNKQIKSKEPDVVYAKYADRVKALITDMFMIYLPMLYIITYVILEGKEDFQSSQLAQLSGVLVYGFIYAVLLSKFGQTPGKKAYAIKVVDAYTFEHISFLRALFRFLAFLICAATLLGLFVPFYRKDKRALHDLLARTSVIAI